MKRAVILFFSIFVLFAITKAGDITMNQKYALYQNLHENSILADWDSVRAIIRDYNATAVETVTLSTAGTGRYGGYWTPTATGNFTVEYNCFWSGGIMCEEENFTVLDTVAFHGAAAGLTAPQIVNEFEDRGYGFGSGVFACTVYAKLSVDSSVVPNIRVIAKNTDETSQLAHGYTNANGWMILGLDSIAGGAYHKFWLIDVEYSFAFPESADVDGDTTITFYGTAFDYGDPPAENQCAVYDQVFDIELDSLSGVVVTARLLVPSDSILRYDGFPVTPYKKTYITDASGRWRFDLIPNSDPCLLPTGTRYVFKFWYPMADGEYFIYEDTTEVPDQESARYRDISGKM